MYFCLTLKSALLKRTANHKFSNQSFHRKIKLTQMHKFLIPRSHTLRSADLDTSPSLSLSNVRNALVQEEDNIIFNLLTRARFTRNLAVYDKDHFEIPKIFSDGTKMSLLDYLLCGTEQLHGSVRRYTSPDEHPFFPTELPKIVLSDIQYPKVLPETAAATNINDEIFAYYVENIVPNITSLKDDGNYGSAAIADVNCLQSISKRINLGKFVAEVKFRSDPDTYTDLIQKKDRKQILKLLTHSQVEEQVIERVRMKTASQLRLLTDPDQYEVNPEKVASLYRDWIIPLTKKVEVEVLISRF